jgi:hypothetical protein
MNTTRPPPRGPEHSLELSHPSSVASFGESLRSSQVHLSKIQFSVFSGDDPQLWRSWCESYFEMYVVESVLWVKVASMHLEGPATHWLQSVERRVCQADWTEFCSLIHEHFGRDQHEALIWQLFHIRHTCVCE